MTKLINRVAAGDPINDFFIRGFDSYEEASQHIIDPESTPPKFEAEVPRGQDYEFEGSAVIVFYDFSSRGGMRIFSVTRCGPDLTLSIGSWGGQLLITAGK